MNQNKKVGARQYISLLLSAIFILGASYAFSPEKASAIGLCSAVGNPSIQVDIDGGGTFTSSGSINVTPGSTVTFHVYTYAEPSSPNSITFPGGSYTYPGPSGYYSPGRTYTTSAINSTSYINIWLGQNCQADPNPGSETSLTITINVPTCAINSFTCSSANQLAWSTANCSARSISPTIGTVGAIGSATGSGGTTYTLTADSKTSTAYCPTIPAPQLQAYWSQTGTQSMTETLQIGGSKTLQFMFSNIGEVGSVIDVYCTPVSANPSGLSANNPSGLSANNPYGCNATLIKEY